MSSDVTRDALFGGALSIRQPAPRTGYRVNVDAILLGAFAAHAFEDDAPRRPARHAVDLGSGVGAVGLTLLHLGAAAQVTMVEQDERLAGLARLNAEDNDRARSVVVIHDDVARLTKAATGEADLVVCNPPYVPPGRGRPPLARVRGAKYGELSAFIEAARRVAGRRARVCFVYPAIEATTLLLELRSCGLEAKRLRAVHGRPHDPARVVLVECAAGRPGGLVIEAPLVETEGAERSPGLAALLARPRV